MAEMRDRGTPPSLGGGAGGPETLPLAIVTLAVCGVLGVVALLLRPQSFLDRVATLAIGLLVALVIFVVASILPSAGAAPDSDATMRADLDSQRLELERLRRELDFLNGRVEAFERSRTHRSNAISNR